MSTHPSLPYSFQWSSEYAHIAWADLRNVGVLTEIAVVALDNRNGDLYFIELAGLDSIDRERLTNIISKREALKYPLWDLMSNTTLKNGINALEYFNQLVRVRTVSGQIFAPGSGKTGTGMRPGDVALPPAQQRAQQPQTHTQVNAQAEPTRRGPGRPPAVKK